MSKLIDLTGRRFGKLLVIKKGETINKHVRWECLCDCGKTAYPAGNNLKNGTTTSCGCSRLLIDFIGKQFGKLLVVKRGSIIQSRTRWECICDCGKTCYATGHSLNSGNKKSCGCIRWLPKHGMHNTKIYRCWNDIQQRCYNTNNPRYKDYGGRGITVYSLWRRRFENFHEYLKLSIGEPPTPKHSLDRIDNNKGYEPGNVKWSTPKEQQSNMRNNQLLEFQGQTKTMSQWAEIFNIKYCTLRTRILRGNWPIEQALPEPLHQGVTYRNSTPT
jgi:hypothetical protein